MDESCPANHKMFPIEVRVGATGLATGCPNSIVKGTNTSLESTCCNHSDAACLDTYHNTLNDTITYVYHEMCMGRKQCVNYPIVRSTTTGPVVFCDQSLYHSTTTVLELKYHCIQGRVLNFIKINISGNFPCKLGLCVKLFQVCQSSLNFQNPILCKLFCLLLLTLYMILLNDPLIIFQGVSML